MVTENEGQFPKGDKHPNRKKYLERLSLGTATCFVCNETKEIEKGHYINRCKNCSSNETRLKHFEAYQAIKAAEGCPDPYCLDFHHKDPLIKHFTLATQGSRPITPEVLEEMACKNCHAKFHAGRFSLEGIGRGDK